jgi:hypothetical protein
MWGGGATMRNGVSQAKQLQGINGKGRLSGFTKFTFEYCASVCSPVFQVTAFHGIFFNYSVTILHFPILSAHTAKPSFISVPKQYKQRSVILWSNYFPCPAHLSWPPPWSSGQSFWLQIQRSRVRFPALPDFLCSSGSGTGSTQPREPPEVNWGATWLKK